MKLKRLLPIASIAGVAAVVTPLVTSCNSGKTFVYTFDSRNPALEFEPENQIKRDEQKSVYAKDATEDYLADANKNKQIFAEDLIYSTIKSYQQAGDLPSYLSYGKATVKIDKIEPKTGKCSFLFTADIGDSAATVGRDGVSVGFAVKNIDFVMYYNHGWYFMPYVAYLVQVLGFERGIPTAIAYLKSNSGWSFTFDIKLMVHDQDRSFQIEINEDTGDDTITEFFSSDVFSEGIQSFIFDNMYYWQNVRCRDYK